VKKSVILLILAFVFLGVSVFAADNVTMTPFYSTIDISSYGGATVTQGYSHTYQPPNISTKEKVENSFSASTQGVGYTRIHNITSVGSTGNAYHSSFASYKALNPETTPSYLNVSDKMGLSTCCSEGPCGQSITRLDIGSASGYEAKLSDGYVGGSMQTISGPMASASYSIYAKSNTSDNELKTGTSVGASTGSGNLTQNYSRHIHVTGQFSVNNSAEVN
jgi:hypothetical protein